VPDPDDQPRFGGDRHREARFSPAFEQPMTDVEKICSILSTGSFMRSYPDRCQLVDHFLGIGSPHRNYYLAVTRKRLKGYYMDENPEEIVDKLRASLLERDFKYVPPPDLAWNEVDRHFKRVFLLRCLINKINDQIDRQVSFVSIEDEAGENGLTLADSLFDGDDSPEANAMLNDLIRHAQICCRRVPVDMQRVFWLRLQGHKHKEIATLLELPEFTVRKQFTRTAEEVRKCLKRKGYGLPQNCSDAPVDRNDSLRSDR